MSNPYRDYRGMAYAAGVGFWEDGSLSPAIERFAALVAAAERDRMCQQFNIPKELAYEKATGNEAN